MTPPNRPGPKPYPVWQQIRDALAADIADGRYGAGDRLPSEAALSARFEVNRHTVRRALAALQDAGTVVARRGAGVFVTQVQLPYRLGPQSRFSRNLSALGLSASRRFHRLETAPATTEEAGALGLADGAPVHLVEGTSSAEGTPVITTRLRFPADRLPGLPASLAAQSSITEALAADGVTEYRRLWTRLRAERADGTVARHLRLPEGAPVIRTLSLNVAPDGTPVEYGHAWFATDRVELVIDEESFATL